MEEPTGSTTRRTRETFLKRSTRWLVASLIYGAVTALLAVFAYHRSSWSVAAAAGCYTVCTVISLLNFMMWKEHEHYQQMIDELRRNGR